jgi:hypothetical protein
MGVILWRRDKGDHRCDLEGGMVVEKVSSDKDLEEHVEKAVREVGIAPLLNDRAERGVQQATVGSQSQALPCSQGDAARETHGDDLGIDRVGHPRIPVDRGRPVQNKARVLDTVVVEVDPNYPP